MNVFLNSLPGRFIIGLAAGAAIASVDNFAFGGEISPIIIVVLLLAVTAITGAVWGKRGWIISLAAWVCLPAAHLVNHVFGFADSLHPNTYTSIIRLGVFSFVVTIIGTGAGMSVRRLTNVKANDDSGSV